MKVLVVVTNIFVFLEELLVINQLFIGNESIYFTINIDYVKSREVKNKLISDIYKTGLNLEYITWGKIQDIKWDIMLCSSYLSDVTYEKLSKVKYKQNILVEDGSYDYFVTDLSHMNFLKNKILYLFRPQDCAARYVYKDIRAFKQDRRLQRLIIEVYSNQLNELKSLSLNTPILFTSPLDSDFSMKDMYKQTLKFIDYNFRGQTLIIKKHPRDLCDYNSKYVNIINCSTNIPGQILDMMFNGIKLFTFPSTICFMSGKVDKMLILKLRSINYEYNSFFNNIKRFECFSIREI